MAANGARNQLGWSLQLGTAQFLNCFLDDPEDVPAAMVDYVAEQLSWSDHSCDETLSPGQHHELNPRIRRRGRPTEARARPFSVST